MGSPTALRLHDLPALQDALKAEPLCFQYALRFTVAHLVQCHELRLALEMALMVCAPLRSHDAVV